MKYQELVVNGCSYMEAYAQRPGYGHVDLANRLGIPSSSSLAIGGSANTRIIRTTLKHSYQTTRPTFYVLGMTFLSRLEIPILENQTEFEGRWTNPQNQQFAKDWQHGWSQAETDQFVNIKLKSEVCSILDRIEDLMYKIVSMINDLKSRGHGILVYQQADDVYNYHINDPRLDLFKKINNIIDGYAWKAIEWQHEQGVEAMHYGSNPLYTVPEKWMHRKNGHHQVLNNFLVDYIKKEQLLY
jgi:hypothetical protein